VASRALTIVHDHQPVVLDTGALLALAARDQQAAFLRRGLLRLRASVLVPIVVLPECVRGRGPRDAAVERALRVAALLPLTESAARHAGALLATTGARRGGAALTIDAMVVATAAELRGCVLLTGDPGDLGRLAADLPHVEVRDVAKPAG